MRIVQITDIHITTDTNPVLGVDTRKNFLNTLRESLTYNPDILVLTGDLAFQSGNRQVYIWIKEQLDSCGVKEYRIIGGNHDDIITMSEVFGLDQYVHGDELYYSVSPAMIFLDTAKAYCSDAQWTWLRQQVEPISEISPIVFMHHPPFKSGMPHMDNKYAFKQPDRFMEIFNSAAKAPVIFCGHYHSEISMEKAGIRVFITPSTYLQIGSRKEEFEVDHRIPAFRIIDINPNSIITTVRYVFDK
jgi:Icc protein